MPSNPDIEDLLSFSGLPTENPAQFIQTINRRAFAQGKSKDDEWLAQYAAICLADDALQWYYDLAEETQNSGKKLFQALLKEFSNRRAKETVEPPVTHAESDIIVAAAPASLSAPVPAAAAPPPILPAARSITPLPNVRVGRIEFADAVTGESLGYVNRHGGKLFAQAVEDALLVEIPSVTSPNLAVSMRVLVSVYIQRELFVRFGLLNLLELVELSCE